MFEFFIEKLLNFITSKTSVVPETTKQNLTNFPPKNRNHYQENKTTGIEDIFEKKNKIKN